VVPGGRLQKAPARESWGATIFIECMAIPLQSYTFSLSSLW
jgi:hypothetical protein